MAKNTQKRSINFSTETLESLDKLAAKKHTTASELVRDMLIRVFLLKEIGRT